MKKKGNLKKKINFIFIVVISVFVTIIFAKYIANIMFDGKNSLEVYSGLKQQKKQLEYNIKNLQLDNARLQKEYFELKNLEPDND